MILLISFLAIFTTAQSPEAHCLYIERSTGIWHIEMNDIDLLLKKYNIKYPKIVKAQICTETSFLTSQILRLNHNCIGMRYAKGRKTTAISEQYGCAVFRNIEDCIKDLKIWQDLYYKRGGDYYDFLQRIHYATDPDYIKMLKTIKI
jgi:hypothetical protein